MGKRGFKLKKTVMTLTTVTVVGLSSSLFGTVTFAETNSELEDIQEDRTEVQAELSDAETQVAEVLQELSELNEEIERTENALNENQEVLDETEKNITEREEKIETLEEEIVELEEKIEERFEILKERAVSYQQNGGDISYAEVIFGSQNFGDFISRVSAVNKITESDAKLMEDQEKDKALVEEKQDEVTEKLDELKAEKVELEGMQTVIEDQQKQNNQSKSSLQDKEQELTALVEELKLEDSQLADLENEVEDRIAAAEAEEQAETQVEAAPSTEVADASVTSTDENSSESTSSNSNSNSASEDTEESSSDSSSSTAPAAHGNINTVINAGFDHLGTPYVWGGKTPSGFDCSGFVAWAFAQAGISVPSYTGGLANTGTQVSTSNMQPGDIVFFDTYKTDGHVGIYLGGGQFIGAQSSTGLDVADMSSGYWSDNFSGHVRRVN